MQQQEAPAVMEVSGQSKSRGVGLWCCSLGVASTNISLNG